MITDMHNASTSFFNCSGSTLKYEPLNSLSMQNSRDKRLAVLRKVQYKTTTDGRPFVRASIEDINGYVLIGRMFDCQNQDAVGNVFTPLIGKLVCIDFDIDYYNGSMCLRINDIEHVDAETARKASSLFTGMYNFAESKLRECNSLLSEVQMSEGVKHFYDTYCNVSILLSVSDESLACGLRGFAVNILYNILCLSSSVSSEAIVAFIYSLLVWFKTRQPAEVNTDDCALLFIASMMDKRVDAAAAGLFSLADRLSEFAALFSGKAKVISADSYFLFNLYKLLSETSNIKVAERRIPPSGFCSYKDYTVRRSK